MKTRLQTIEDRIAEIDIAFSVRPTPRMTLRQVADCLLERWALSIKRDELRAEHARLTASFDTCSVDG